MVFYTKIPFFRRLSLLSISYKFKWNELFSRMFNKIDEGSKIIKPIYIFDKNKKVEDWTFVNDKIFGGSSSSKLMKLDDSFLFSGNLKKLSNNKNVVLPSFSRIWLIFQMFHPDFSEYDGIEIECKSNDKEEREYQFQFIRQSFMDNIFYFSNFKPEKEYKTFKLPFKQFKMNRDGKNIGIFDPEIFLDELKVTTIGCGVESFILNEFSLEIKSIKIYRN
eukprot:gene2632-3829_t